MSDGKNLISHLSKMEKVVAEKLAYEWKNLYRCFVAQDTKDSGLVHISDFDAACLKFKINFTREEIRTIKKLFGDPSKNSLLLGGGSSVLYSPQDDMVNYKSISVVLGLHKESYNHLASTVSAQRVRKLFKLRDCINTITPVQE